MIVVTKVNYHFSIKLILQVQIITHNHHNSLEAHHIRYPYSYKHRIHI